MEMIQNPVRIKARLPLGILSFHLKRDWRFLHDGRLHLIGECEIEIEGRGSRKAKIAFFEVAPATTANAIGQISIGVEPSEYPDSLSLALNSSEWNTLLDCRFCARLFSVEIAVIGGSDEPPHPDDLTHFFDVKIYTMNLVESLPT